MTHHKATAQEERVDFATLPPVSALSPQFCDVPPDQQRNSEAERLAAMLGLYTHTAALRRLDLPQSHPHVTRSSSAPPQVVVCAQK